MTKIFLRGMLILGIASILFTGCGKQKPAPQTVKKAEPIYVDPEYQGAPKWVLMPQAKGYIAETGSAQRNVGNDISFQRAEAKADARKNIAQQIEIKVNSMIKTYKAATGSGKDATFDKSSEDVSKQIASQTLKGTRVEDTWISRTGTLYVLMVLDTKNVVQKMEESIKTSFKNDKALYQRFLASKAQGELDAELEKLNK
jgi:hypothetical protein